MVRMTTIVEIIMSGGDDGCGMVVLVVIMVRC